MNEFQRSDNAWTATAVGVAAAGLIGTRLHLAGESWLVLALGPVALVMQWPNRLALAIALAVIGITAFGAQRDTEALHIVALPNGGVWTHFSGTVMEDPRPSRFTTDVTIEVERLEPVRQGMPTSFRAQVRAARPNAGRLLGLDRGDRVSGLGTLTPVVDAYLASKHIATRIRLQEIAHIDFDHAWWSPVVGIRREAVHSLEALPGESGPLLAAFVFGDTRRVDASVQMRMRASGLGHLFAVSGANVTFVLAGMYPLLMFLPRRPRLIASLVVVWLFVVLAGLVPSVLRAGVMLTAALIDQWVARGRRRVRGLAAAVITCIVIDPFLTQSLGFALSVAATCGMIGVAPWLAHRLGDGPIVTASAPTVAAQACTAPVLWAAGLQVPLSGLAANVWAAVLV
ncbi:MAG: ComEC/Rec2 family competence protein, partial [Acidimicrobiia bacterium]